MISSSSRTARCHFGPEGISDAVVLHALPSGNLDACPSRSWGCGPAIAQLFQRRRHASVGNPSGSLMEKSLYRRIADSSYAPAVQKGVNGCIITNQSCGQLSNTRKGEWPSELPCVLTKFHETHPRNSRKQKDESVHPSERPLWYGASHSESRS